MVSLSASIISNAKASSVLIVFTRRPTSVQRPCPKPMACETAGAFPLRSHFGNVRVRWSSMSGRS